ncbi:hypothetical protein CON94_09145 [Bacillus pseudomycoides]|uniref:conjugal transfer protein n=1 Tax=Bacillus pseudomycoides TaxID=64104 RepID=UPI000BEBA311|nr:conjugal transfer protein [Bacillus pseudomycoides]PEA83830.1 hypothetical protein CON99_09680 [Bacillus pseudomycoides]PEF75669.1 hypothetical protein CON94_09145 [Bacillus pseudomycoides]
MKENFNLKQIFTHPITLYKFGKYSLPFGVSLVRFTVGLVILLIMFIFKKFFMAIGSMIPGLTVLLYGGIPFFLSGYLVKKKYDGKKIIYFLYDFTDYFFSVYVRKTKYCNDEVVQYMDEKKITIEPIEIERGREEDATKKRIQRRVPQSHVNSQRGCDRAL